uniref:Blue (type 1) copper domain-containing protein n=1 Tax=Caldilinea aerophila TaxID=133453 RepID=A0A7C1JRC4_9CHLR
MTRLIYGTLILTMLLLAACGGSATPTPTPTPTPAPTPTPTTAPSAQQVIAATLDVIMHDIYFGDDSNNIANPPVWRVPAGAQVTVNLDNQGALEHNWAVVKQGVELPIPFMPDQNKDLLFWETGVLQGGQKDSESFTAPSEPGEYIVICTVAGHYPAMQGRLIVE